MLYSSLYFNYLFFVFHFPTLVWRLKATTMKGRKRSLKLKEIKSDETQQSYDEQRTWKVALKMVKQTIWRGGQMLPICLHFCVVV